MGGSKGGTKRRQAGVGAVDDLGPEARRLLRALVDGAEAFPDPVDEHRLGLRRRAATGPTLGGGTVPRTAALLLVGRDLARWDGAGRLAVLRASGAGVAHQRRSAAAEDPFFAQHHETAHRALPAADGTGAPSRVRVDAEESPLDWLARRKGADGAPLLDAPTREAGERLRRDLTLGGLLPRVTQRWEAAPGGGAQDPAGAADAALAARQRVSRALTAVGPDFADLLLDLCGFLKGLETLERERGWPPRSGKVVVRLALQALARHYGLRREARGPAHSLGVRVWQDAQD